MGRVRNRGPTLGLALLLVLLIAFAAPSFGAREAIQNFEKLQGEAIVTLLVEEAKADATYTVAQDGEVERMLLANTEDILVNATPSRNAFDGLLVTNAGINFDGANARAPNYSLIKGFDNEAPSATINQTRSMMAAEQDAVAFRLKNTNTVRMTTAILKEIDTTQITVDAFVAADLYQANINKTAMLSAADTYAYFEELRGLTIYREDFDGQILVAAKSEMNKVLAVTDKTIPAVGFPNPFCTAYSNFDVIRV